MKILLVILVLAITEGCGSPLSRPTPSESQYRKRFLGMLTEEQIQDLRFAYHGAIGGEASIARFTTDPSGIMAIRAATKREEVYEPDRDEDREVLRRRFQMYSEKRELPDWFDFPFAKTLPVFIDSGDMTNDHPSYSYEWYIDEETGTVYFSMING